MKTFLITGASRGIGLTLAQKALASGHRVYCACRNPDGARTLWEMEQDYQHAHMVKLDVQDDVETIRACLPLDVAIDFLVNNAGVLEEFGPGLADFDLELLERSFQVNTFGPIKVTRAFLPNLALSARPVVAHMTSRLGSLSDNTSGGAYGYRMSKAALNMFHVNFAHEYKSMISIALHPGWVKTRMGGDQAQTDVWQSVEGLYRVLMDLKPEHSGSFVDFNGQPISW